MKSRIATVGVLVGILFAAPVATAAAQPVGGPGGAVGISTNQLHPAASGVKYCVFSKTNYTAIASWDWPAAGLCWALGGKVQNNRP